MDAIKKVEECLTAPLLEAGYELASVSLAREKNGQTLHIMVDRDDPISMDDIVKVSDLINPILDLNDPVNGPYTLDVSSLGAEKPLHLERLEHYRNRYVHLHLINPILGKNDWEGTIAMVNETNLTLSYYDKNRLKSLEIVRSNIDKARLAIKF